MSEDNSNQPVDINTDNLDDFENIFFNRKASEPEPKEEDVVEEDQEVHEDDHSQPEDEDEVIEEEEGEEDADSEPEPQPKPKNKTQERIEKLVAEARVAERERDAEKREKEFLRSELERVQKLMQESKPEPKESSVTAKLAPGAPRPDAVDEKGNELYPLGEFDPKYIAELTKFTINQEFEAAKQAQAEAAAKQQALAAQEEIKSTWNTNLEKAEEGLPDIRQKIGKMSEAFQGIDPNYGEYLAGTIMSSEFGPEIMYFLADNIGEARKIVASGPAAATRAIGRLEAQFIAATEHEEKQQSNTQSVSHAPPPPEVRSRGARSATTVRGDTDDLDAFEKVFFTKKR